MPPSIKNANKHPSRLSRGRLLSERKNPDPISSEIRSYVMSP